MKTVEDFLVAVYCLVSDFFKLIVGDQRLRRRGPPPSLTDSEVITMELVGEFLGHHADKDLWAYFRRHWLPWFPKLGDRSCFVRQAANLWRVKQLIRCTLSRALGSNEDIHQIVDGVPISSCVLGRANRRKLFRDVTAKSYCAAKKVFYVGFKGHLRITASGLISNFTLTPANVDEREAAWDLTDERSGSAWWFADKGYLSRWSSEELKELGITLDTPVRSNMKDTCTRKERSVRNRVRRLIETVLSQLTGRFQLAKVRARDLLHLTSRIERKLLAHTIAYAINRSLGREPLDFDGLIAQ